VAPRGGLNVLRRRLSQRVLDIKVRQCGAVFWLSAGSLPASTAAWFLPVVAVIGSPPAAIGD
jgi:hypothetical protein